METSAPAPLSSEARIRRIGSELRPFRSALLATLGIALVFWAQFDLSARHFSFKTLLLLLAGVGLAVGSAVVARYRPLITEEEVRAPANGAPREWSRRRLLAVPCAAVFTLMAYSLSEFDRFSAQGVILWGLAIVLFVAVWWQPAEPSVPSLWERLRRLPASLRQQPLSLALAVAAFALVAGLAAFFRFHSLNSLPADAGALEADIGGSVRDILNGSFHVYMPRDVGEGGLLYVTAGLVKFFGASPDYDAIKITSAVAGLLAVGATYLLLREFFASQLVALIGVLLMAVAHWPVTLARSSLTAASAPLFAALTLLFLVRALKYDRTNNFLFCGLTAGVGLYFYEGLRVLPFVIVACLALKFVAVLSSRRKRDVFPLFGRSILLGLLLLIVFAPMARAWYDQPDYYLRTVDSRLVGSEPRDYSAPARFADNLKRTFLMFSWEGDAAYRNDIPGEPALDEGMAALLAVGAVLAAATWLRYRRGMFPYAAVAFVGLVLPSALSLAVPSENPSMIRASGAIPLTFGFAALPVAFVLSAAARPLSQKKGLVVGSLLMIGLTGALAISSYHWYFHDYRDSSGRAALATVEVATAIDYAVSRDPRIDSVYVVAFEGWMESRAIALILGQPDWIAGGAGLPETLETPAPDRNDLYVLPDSDSVSRDRLEQTYPRGISEWHNLDSTGRSFVLFTTLPPP